MNKGYSMPKALLSLLYILKDYLVYKEILITRIQKQIHTFDFTVLQSFRHK